MNDPTEDPMGAALAAAVEGPPVLGAFWIDPCPIPLDSTRRWCEVTHDVGDGLAPYACTRPATHLEHDEHGHVAGGDGSAGVPGTSANPPVPRRLRVLAIWPADPS